MTKNVLIAVPTFENIYPDTFKSIFDLKKSQGVNLDFEFVRGYDCARARNKIANKAIEGEYDYLLMVDSDIIVPSNAVDIFSSVDYSLILGYSPRKDDETITEIYSLGFGYRKEARYSYESLRNNESDFIQINGGSFGCAWISVDIFSKLQYPYFQYLEYPDGELFSEDLYFCNSIQGAGDKVFVATKVPCKHIGRQIVG